MSYAHPTPPAPKKGLSTGAKVGLGCGIPFVLGSLLLGGCAVVGGAMFNEVDKAVKKDAQDDKRAAKEDVELLSCKIVDDNLIGRDLKAQVKITNNGKERANYQVEGELLDQKGNKVEELFTSVDDLAPGTSSTQNFGGMITSDQLDGVTKGQCKILDVTRDEWLASN